MRHQANAILLLLFISFCNCNKDGNEEKKSYDSTIKDLLLDMLDCERKSFLDIQNDTHAINILQLDTNWHSYTRIVEFVKCDNDIHVEIWRVNTIQKDIEDWPLPPYEIIGLGEDRHGDVFYVSDPYNLGERYGYYNMIKTHVDTVISPGKAIFQDYKMP